MNNKPPPVPRSHVATLFGGVAVVATGLAAWWYGLLRLQARKDEQGAFATWERRILQAQAYAGKPDRPTMADGTPETTASQPDRRSQGARATDFQHEANLGPASSQARADRSVQNPHQTKSGESAPSTGSRPGPEPTPQRTRDNDSRIYTKAPRR